MELLRGLSDDELKSQFKIYYTAYQARTDETGNLECDPQVLSYYFEFTRRGMLKFCLSDAEAGRSKK
jgi:hypothetical protein